MNERYIEGIVLKSIPFQDSDRIVNVFTPEKGIISFLVKHLSTRSPLRTNLTSPLCQAKFVYRKSYSDLHHLIDGTIVNLHLSLRHSYKYLHCGGKMLHAIKISQMPGKSAPLLYTLLMKYLNQISYFLHPEILLASFQLKLLKHEGILALNKICLACSKKEASHLIKGESRCAKCAQNTMSLSFSSTSWNMLLQLCHAKKFTTLHSLKPYIELPQDVETLYHSLYEASKKSILLR